MINLLLLNKLLLCNFKKDPKDQSMFKGKKDEVAWRGMDAIKNKKKARTNVYSFILTSDHHCTPDARPLHL